MATYTFQTGPGKYAHVVQHLAVFDIDVLSSALADGVYTVTTSAPLPAEQIPHLDLTAAA